MTSVAVLTAIVLASVTSVAMTVVATPKSTVLTVVVVTLVTLRTMIFGCTLALVVAVFVRGGLVVLTSVLIVVLTSVLAVFIAVFIAILVALFVIEAGDAILLGTICRLLYFGNVLLALELLDLASCAVCSDNFAYS